MKLVKCPPAKQFWTSVQRAAVSAGEIQLGMMAARPDSMSSMVPGGRGELLGEGGVVAARATAWRHPASALSPAIAVAIAFRRGMEADDDDGGDDEPFAGK